MKNIFDLHDDILNDYKLYIDSFINITDAKIIEKVIEELIQETYIQNLC